MEVCKKISMKDSRVYKVIEDDDSAWIMYDSEGRDPYFKKFITDKTVVTSVAIVAKQNVFLIVHELDADNFKDLDDTLILYEKRRELINSIEAILKKLGYPSRIYLNFSDSLDVNTDVLGYGTYKFLSNNISNMYSKGNKEVKFLSADEIIYSLIDSKSDEDIYYMKIAANRALEIIESSFKKVKIGMTEREVVNLFHDEFNLKPQYFEKYGIVNEYYAWNESGCPIVLTGPNLAKGGHCEASNQKIKEGFTIYCDFGVIIELQDGRKYASDLQRMGYVLRKNEKFPPKEVINIFNTLKESIREGVKNCNPNKRGYEIDEIVRTYLTEKGYKSYNHATGHPVGEIAHSPGTSLSPKGSMRSNLFLKENGVYTIEPRIQIENGGSIEEMIQVTKNGGISLCRMQEDIYLI